MKHLSCAQVGQYLALSPAQVRRLCQKGIIKAELVAGTWMIPDTEANRTRFDNRPKSGPKPRKRRVTK